MNDGGVAAELLFGAGRVSAEEWDACAGPGDVFVSHGLFLLLEECGAASGRSGWLPLHLAVRDGCCAVRPRGRLAAVVPLYVKSHSQGEFVQDRDWAAAYDRAGLRYYPKLQIAVPFFSITGRRLLLRPDADPRVLPVLVSTLEQVARHQKVSSIHATFCLENEWRALGETGWLQRLGLHCRWQNRGYLCLDDFLASLTEGARRALDDQRAALSDSGMSLRTLVGSEISSDHWDEYYRHSVATAKRDSGFLALNREFFHRLAALMGERAVLVTDGPDSVLYLIGGTTLYGRTWGGERAICSPYGAAFTLCAIDFAISRGLAWFDPGVSCDSLLQESFQPVLTYSAHWVRKCGVREVLAEHLEKERALMAHLLD